MEIKHALLALLMCMVLSLAASRAQAQMVGGGYVGFGQPGFGGVVGVGTPYIVPAPAVAPVVPYAVPYAGVVLQRPVYPARIYGPGWGYGPRYYGPRYHGPYRYGYARRWR